MAYDTFLADRVREYLASFPNLSIEEKRMFGGLAFLVNDKMCVNVSGERLMCRFDPVLHESLAEHPFFETMMMRGKAYQGYGYISPKGFQAQKDLEYWVALCLDFNERAKSSKK